MTDEERAITNIGAHLLGRVYVEDKRDDGFTMQEALTQLAMPSDALLDQTVREIIESGGFTDYSWLMRFWEWLQTVIGSVTPPAPTPVPDPTPSPTPTPQPVQSKLWSDPIQLDQGRTGHCVGFGWAGWGDADPVEDHYLNADGNAIYYEAKVIDGQPRQENGSSVRSGAKAMQNRTRLASYVWASTVGECKAWVLNQGPLTVGTNWYNDMFNPDSNFYVHPTGGVAGGHCYLMLGYDTLTDTFTFQNSWGSGWGDSGRFKMKARDFAKLLLQNGEACAGLEQPLH